MVTGLVERYRNSNVPPPKLLYVNRDSYSTKLKSHFHEWSNLVIRLDVWHFMRRFAAGCCSESHALYATFMSRLSACVFEWDTKDLQRLYAAKRGQLSSSEVWILLCILLRKNWPCTATANDAHGEWRKQLVSSKI
ncbi:unnamed protein product [Porites evermanni]|uniref:Transposase n=1 Tax=Porites evermanni TaxID=104178 RepID=A0ABN8R408_9CNID|nr:unnamed protein product [Porites evermanni]